MQFLLTRLQDVTGHTLVFKDGLAKEVGSICRLPWDNGAPEQLPDWACAAAVFFSARAVESAVTQISDRFWYAVAGARNAPPALDDRIGMLEAAGVVDSEVVACLHAVRRLGNSVRHRADYPAWEQTEFCLVMLSRAAPQLARAGKDQVTGQTQVARTSQIGAATSLERECDQLQSLLTSNDIDDAKALATALPNLLRAWRLERSRRITVGNDQLLWVITRALDAGRRDLASDLMAPFNTDQVGRIQAVVTDGDGFRVAPMNRLAALCLSRQGNPDAAINLLLPCAQRAGYLPERLVEGKSADTLVFRPQVGQNWAETLGILAGAFKRKWVANATTPKRPINPDEHLRVAAALYAAVHQGQPWNHYAAINHCATLAWRSQFNDASRVATELVGRLAGAPAPAQNGAPRWMEWTNAEALLIAGQHDASYLAYVEAKQGVTAASAGAWASACNQLRLHAAMGIQGAERCLVGVEGVPGGLA